MVDKEEATWGAQVVCDQHRDQYGRKTGRSQSTDSERIVRNKRPTLLAVCAIDRVHGDESKQSTDGRADAATLMRLDDDGIGSILVRFPSFSFLKILNNNSRLLHVSKSD